MNVWYHHPTIFRRRFALRTAGLFSLCVALTTTLLFANVSHAATGINSTISFQGRLQYASGGVVADGHYNIQFKIYQDGDSSGTGGTLKWTETYINNGGTSGVDVVNGYFSVNLGSNTAFGNSIDWNQDTLWLSMNVAGSSASCTTFNSGTCVADGEMTPMQRLTAVPYAIQAQNANQLNGMTAANFVQLAQGVQNDSVNNSSSIFINKTGTGGNLLELQQGGTDVFRLNADGNLVLGNTADHFMLVDQSGTNTAGKNFSLYGGMGGAGSGANGGNIVLQGGSAGGTNASGGNVYIDAGAATGSGNDGLIGIGTSHAQTIVIGGNTEQQYIYLGANNSGSAVDVTIGSSGSAAGGSTSIRSVWDTTISTGNTQRARFSGNGNTLYLGNADGSGLAATANSFTIQGTASTGSNVQGGSLTLQAGAATSGNASGGNLVLSGGAGVGSGSTGLVVIGTPTYQTASTQSCSSNCTVTQANVDGNGVVLVGTTASGLTVSLPDPTNKTAGRIVYVTAANGSNDFTLSINGGGTGNLTSMRQNTTATMIWNGNDWTVAGASNSTTLQSAYDNTLQSAGGAELIVSKSSTTNGLTIRDSTTNSVNGTLLQVQSKTAANLFSVSSNVTDYVSDNGAETAGASSSTFPSSTWAATGGATVTRNTTTSNNSIATGQASVGITTAASANSGVSNQLVDPSTGSATALNANMLYSVSLTARLPSGAATFNNLTVLYQYDNNSAHTVTCATGQSVAQTSWTKINCSFTTPASGVTSANVIRIEQTDNTARTFYVDNLSATITASQNYSTDKGVDSALGTNWVAVGGSATQSTSNGYDKSDSAQITTTAATTSGIKNKLAVNPLASNATTTYLYRISAYVQTQTTALTNFTVQYSYDGTNLTNCVDYNTQAVSVSSTVWTQITCMIQMPTNAPTTPYVFFSQGDTTVRTASLYIDNFTMTTANSTTPDVQIGSGSNGGPVTLLTLDSAASAPIESNNQALYGSMYYDTTLGKIQCYQASGWGSCGSAPDNIITISPEYTNAVMHGTGVGTMTSDFCSNALGINDGSAGQSTICGTNQTYNFYKWTSPQSTTQSYSIYVTYQLPSTLKSFTSGSTSLQAKTDSSNASVAYQIYKSNSSGLTACGSSVSVATGATSWTSGVATGTADPSTCSFSPGDSIVFKITASSSSNGNAYIGNIGFTFSNK